MADTHTTTILQRLSMGNRIGVLAEVVVAAYDTGGANVSIGELGLSKVDALLLEQPATSAYILARNVTTGKIQVFNAIKGHAHDITVAKVTDTTGLYPVFYNASTGAIVHHRASGGSDGAISSKGATADIANEHSGGALDLTFRVLAIGY